MYKKNVVVCGAGDHGKIVMDILIRRKWIVHGFLDDVKSGEVNMIPQPMPILGPCGDLDKFDACIIAIGDNAAREKLYNYAVSRRVELMKALDLTAEISESSRIGFGTVVCRRAVIQPESRIGNNVIINTAAIVEHDNIIEDHAHVASGVHLGGHIHIKQGCLIGTGATIMPGVTIGRNSIVGAGTLITKDVEAETTVRERKLWQLDTKTF